MPEDETILAEEQPPHKTREGKLTMNDLSIALVIGMGGFVGANARYVMGRWALEKWGAGFPYGTFLINILGCFILGLFGTLTERLHWNDFWRFAIAVGFVGAFTTFSTFEYESFQLVAQGHLGRAAANVVGSVLVGFAAACAGVAIARLLLRGHP